MKECSESKYKKPNIEEFLRESRKEKIKRNVKGKQYRKIKEGKLRPL